MTKEDLKKRTKAFHISVIKVCNGLPKNAAGFELAKQLIRSSGSVGANYRAACRAKSTADFIYKIEIVIEEADESMYWLEVITEAAMLNAENTGPLLKEANELVSIFVSTVKTAKAKREDR
ncbi:MAG: four helix bundle protein [Bacteroidota bacterium]